MYDLSILLLLVIYTFGFLSASIEENRLLRDLRENYDSVERPVENHKEAVQVKVQVLLQQILEVVLLLFKITNYIKMYSEWKDYKMKWDPAEYGGILDLHLPSSGDGALWKPDILLFNSAEDTFDNSFPVNFVVYYTGDILFVPPGIVKSSCNIDITWFPFDEQICCLRYGSWSYATSQLDLHVNSANLSDKDHMDLTYYLENSEWELLGTPADRLLKPFLNDSFTELHFRLHIRRKKVYYFMNWIIPSIIISLNNLLGFMLPSECGEKITLRKFLNSCTLNLGIFFSFSIIILGCSVMMTILVVDIHFRMPDVYEMSPWVRKTFLEWLPWALLMKRPGHQFRMPKEGCNSYEQSYLLPDEKRASLDAIINGDTLRR
ncbi:unnamed protein product [Enterobius vermicularis]|uniref:Neur_chan_LBD domain-containing protein n=1 Tax=Enterobius vermicularis TaxID=51028 RepID=A0A0N4UYB1_ENTVE|nr:unnamed protein product [Enterobius vermicularis]